MLTPPAYVTGGVEACYQIIDAINKQGGTGVTVFSFPHQNPVPKEYSKYEIKIEGIENSPDNLIIVPEIWPDILNIPDFSKMDKAIWWLSVDNGRQGVDFSKDILHLYQSYYAKNYLKEKGAIRIAPVFDYLSDDYLEEYEEPKKENIICYSIKGEQLAKSLIPLLPEYKFVMLKGMERVAVIETLKKSKVFIDFGNHPGKDRIPRESAILKNCVLTNLKGSARFNEDLPIPHQYKIEEENLEKIANVIKDCVENYGDRIKDFEPYREEIKKQKTEFFQQIKNII